MSFEYIRNYYNVHAYKGMRVKVDGDMGVITGADSQYIRIKFDGKKLSENCHPTWRVTYYNPNGTVLKKFKD